MLRDRDYQTYVYGSKYEYWYDWLRGYFHTKDVDMPRDNRALYHVAVDGLVIELVVLKQWLNVPSSIDPAVDIPCDPLTLVSVPVPKWIDCVKPSVVQS